MSGFLHVPCFIQNQQVIISHPVSHIIQIQKLQYQNHQKNNRSSCKKRALLPRTADNGKLQEQQKQKQRPCHDHRKHVFVFEYVFCLWDGTYCMNKNPAQTSQQQYRG